MSSMQVKVETLRAHASMWDSHAGDARDAAALIAPAVGRGSDFGWLAGEAGVEESFNAWTEAMDLALADAVRCERRQRPRLTTRRIRAHHAQRRLLQRPVGLGTP